MAPRDGELTVKVGVSLEELVTALRAAGDEDREWLLENLLAATSPEYLRSIEEAREDAMATTQNGDAREHLRNLHLPDAPFD